MSIQDVGVRVFLQPLDMIGQDASDFGRRGCKAVSLQAPCVTNGISSSHDQPLLATYTSKS